MVVWIYIVLKNREWKKEKLLFNHITDYFYHLNKRDINKYCLFMIKDFNIYE